jgi:methylenetetrahydrofolate--tRNA-(uracil-5-)-methyltransferase
VEEVTVIGGGIAGCEAAFQLAVRGVPVRLLEMRPGTASPAHHTGGLAELVCSNSLKGTDPASAAGMLKTELAALGSLVLACAHATAVPAGAALAVDRAGFSAVVERALAHAGVRVERQEATAMPDGPVIVATGPLTSPTLEGSLAALLGPERLSFFDAAAPIVDGSTVDPSVCFAASRYDKGGGADYLNCPMDRDEFEAFATELVAADRVELRDFETPDLFQACQPAEEVARRGADALRYGAMKPVGLTDPRTGRRPWAVLQLRPEDREGRAYNLVGMQTNLTFAAQRRVFQMVPGLHSAEFLRYGVMHRNTFVDAPRLLTRTLGVRGNERVRVAGQLSGTEGYLEAAAGGLVAAVGLVSRLRGTDEPALPPVTAFGALLAYATDPATESYQPMHVNLGILPPLDPPVRDKGERKAAYSARGLAAIEGFVAARADLDFEKARRTLTEALA